MTKHSIGLVALAVIFLFSAAPKAEAQSGGQCAEMRRQYGTDIDTASRYRALNQALGDNVSPAAQSANEAKEGNALARARLALETMKSAGCKAAPQLPSPKPYMPSATRCALDTIMSKFGGDLPETCNPMKWQKSVSPRA